MICLFIFIFWVGMIGHGLKWPSNATVNGQVGCGLSLGLAR
jgi:hypothetical protein